MVVFNSVLIVGIVICWWVLGGDGGLLEGLEIVWFELLVVLVINLEVSFYRKVNRNYLS